MEEISGPCSSAIRSASALTWVSVRCSRARSTIAMACAWWTIMSCMNRTSSVSSGPVGRGATAAPVREVLG